jgi:hypothetical protein
VCALALDIRRRRNRNRCQPLYAHARTCTQTAQVNSLTSFETDIPYNYYSMPFCKPPEGVHRAGNAANLGTALMGIKLENSQYNFTVMVGWAGLGWAGLGGGQQRGALAACACVCGQCNERSGGAEQRVLLRRAAAGAALLLCAAETRDGPERLQAAGLLRSVDKRRRQGGWGCLCWGG